MRSGALLAAILAAVPVRGAERVLTWEDAVRESSRANPSLASSRLAVDASRASYYGSFNNFLPTLSLSNSVSESNVSRTPAWGATGSASMSLFDMGRVASIRSAAASLSAAEASLRAASAALRLSLRRTYSTLLFSQFSVETSGRILELRRHNSELVTLRYESGRESKGNRLRSRAQVLQAEVAVAIAQRDLRTARRDMAQQLGREDFEEYAATGTFSSPPPPARPEDFRSLLSLRPDVASAEASLRSSKAALDSARSVLWPSLSANYQRSRAGASEFPSSRYSWSAGASLSYSLFGGGPTAAYQSTLASRKSYESSEAALAAARQAALADLETAWSDYADAADGVRVQDALLEAALQRNDEADVRYASGLLSFDNWEVIVSDRVNTERQAISARRTAMDAEAAWDRAIGRAVGE